MKIHYMFILCGFFTAAAPFAGFGESTLHTFTTPDGRTLNAAITAYNERDGKIQIEREDGNKIWTLPTVFSEPDQEYVRQWIVVDQFMSPMKFKITGKSDKGDTTSSFDTVGGDKVRVQDKIDIKYEITLENRTDFPLKDLRIEYRAFILSKGYEGEADSSRVDGGELHIAEIPPREKTLQVTPPIILITQYKTVTEYSSSSGSHTSYGKKTGKDELEGFWIKISGPEIDGKPAIREWCYPDETMVDFEWQDKTASASSEKTASVAEPLSNNN